MKEKRIVKGEPKVFLVPKGRNPVLTGQKMEGRVSVSGITDRLNLKGNTVRLMVESFGKSFRAVQLLATDGGPKRFWIRPSTLDAPESRSIYAEKSIAVGSLLNVLDMKVSGVVDMDAEWDPKQKALLVHADKSRPSKSHQSKKKTKTGRAAKKAATSEPVESEAPSPGNEAGAPGVAEYFPQR